MLAPFKMGSRVEAMLDGENLPVAMRLFRLGTVSIATIKWQGLAIVFVIAIEGWKGYLIMLRAILGLRHGASCGSRAR